MDSAPIPKRLIQTAKTAELPLFNRAAVASLRALNPDAEYCFFDDARAFAFVEKACPEYWPAFQRFALPIQRFDFFRYLAVYKLGGFYFDTDVFLARGLDPLRASGCVFPFEELTLNTFLRQTLKTDWELGNYAFGARAGHPFLKRILEACVRAQADPRYPQALQAGIPALLRNQFHVLNTTGPGLLTRALCEAPDVQAEVTILFPADVCDPAGWHQFGDFGVHLMQGSWRPAAGKWRARLERFLEVRCRRQLERSSRRLGPLRKGNWVSRFPERV